LYPENKLARGMKKEEIRERKKGRDKGKKKKKR